jgi:hypothetical protein
MASAIGSLEKLIVSLPFFSQRLEKATAFVFVAAETG